MGNPKQCVKCRPMSFHSPDLVRKWWSSCVVSTTTMFFSFFGNICCPQVESKVWTLYPAPIGPKNRTLDRGAMRACVWARIIWKGCILELCLSVFFHQHRTNWSDLWCSCSDNYDAIDVSTGVTGVVAFQTSRKHCTLRQRWKYRRPPRNHWTVVARKQ